ncbi:hypothetical protein CR513_39257, partial [Mucuna pruriens]
MNQNKDWFETYKKIDAGIVFLGNNKACKVVEMFDGMDKVLQEVRYILKLKRNLISLGTLDVGGYGYKSDQGNLKVY